MSQQKNVLGGDLEPCGRSPLAGFYRNGCCDTGPDDIGVHAVCAVMTTRFLEFSKIRGNDLSTPNPGWGFPGLKPGDRWCLCAARWQEALEADEAPPVILAATNEHALAVVSYLDLLEHAIDPAGTAGGKA
ncbi:MAG TPA: DUF2237 domain-containing protein [Candidatus Krumholzibacteria bacterium]|nr:DUF2237 domain-containing protein [Candidatus Krumholzibacteria bacterium]HPD70391.1 DUF2237 domain-containing protein [Candidatus Krumholzibacteria bacterium]HRY39909.1 DUF2237 domain-containing protein [Candidatus Krumholzibacteria bacterium]